MDRVSATFAAFDVGGETCFGEIYFVRIGLVALRPKYITTSAQATASLAPATFRASD